MNLFFLKNSAVFVFHTQIIKPRARAMTTRHYYTHIFPQNQNDVPIASGRDLVLSSHVRFSLHSITIIKNPITQIPKFVLSPVTTRAKKESQAKQLIASLSLTHTHTHSTLSLSIPTFSHTVSTKIKHLNPKIPLFLKSLLQCQLPLPSLQVL